MLILFSLAARTEFGLHHSATNCIFDSLSKESEVCFSIHFEISVISFTSCIITNDIPFATFINVYIKSIWNKPSVPPLRLSWMECGSLNPDHALETPG